MKNYLLFGTLLVLTVFLTSFSENRTLEEGIKECYIADDYCDGWKDGHCEGWKDVKGEYAVCPVAPVCPVPEVGKSGYRAGYNRGFKAGMKAAKKK